MLRLDRIGQLVLLSFLMFALSGCIAVPLIDSIHQTGLSESGRQQLLQKQVKSFHTALFWGSFNEALQMVSTENRSDLKKILLTRKRKGRLVESKIDGVEFDDSSYEASVDVMVKIHDPATNVVSTEYDSQSWTFAVSDGWKLNSLEHQVNADIVG